jgi:hypothetical protein
MVLSITAYSVYASVARSSNILRHMLRGYQLIGVSVAEGPTLEKKGFHDDDNQVEATGRTAGWDFEL